MSESRGELLAILLREYWIIREIKNRCKTVTDLEMVHITEAVRVFNLIIGRKELRASACKLPHIVSRSRQVLKAEKMLKV